MSTIANGWNWRISGHARLASLASAWVLALLLAPFGFLLLPIAIVRSALSVGQAALNHRLAKRHPLAPRDRTDWYLFGLTFLASCLYSALDRAMAGAWAPLLLTVVLVPFSAIQLRMVLRSYQAGDEAVAPSPAAMSTRPVQDVPAAA